MPPDVLALSDTGLLLQVLQSLCRRLLYLHQLASLLW